ncbi:MAG: helix-turn-helix transcriptional regulator [Oscillospiraceae bacterium]|jgi:putative transcriptional regulator|nr:helix-turn-helix transcriptional regulator [Oscillospiraceae bacterium]
MLQYKMNVLQELKNAGYSTYRIRAEKILSEGTMQRLRTGSTAITVESLGILCNILRCQPGDILEWAAEE